MSTLRSGCRRVEMGLKCTSAHTSSPLLTPPVIPPCRLVRWWNPRPASNRGTSCTGDPRRRLASTGALQHVAGVVESVLEGTGQVGVSWAHAGDPLGLEVAIVDLHRPLPVLPVTVGDDQRDR